MEKLIGLARFLIAMLLLVLGIVGWFSSYEVTAATVAVLVGIYFVLGAYKHADKSKVKGRK